SLLISRPPGHPHLPSFPTRRSSDLITCSARPPARTRFPPWCASSSASSAARRGRRLSSSSDACPTPWSPASAAARTRSASSRIRSEEHTSELQSLAYLVCRLLLEKK